MKKLLLIPVFFITISLSAQNDFDIAKNADIFISILKELNAKYADEINPTDLVTKAISGMLETLDPYSVYYPESKIEEFKLMTTGQYGGIGALIQPHGNEVVILEPYENSPAHKVGLRAGDIILKINGQSVRDKNSSDVSTILKGQPGTSLNIEIERPTDGKKYSFSVKREDIKFPSVPYSGMLNEQIGYINLNQFTEKASSEVKDAFLKLKGQGMKYLILDLRNNGGGLLHEAVNIMNIFVDQNIKIAETKGKIKEQNNVFKTRNVVVDKDIPVVVLVNEASASSSEIVAGAFQDLDRGVIIGKKTFGKGLVQNIVPLSYNTSFKITVSKYYIPSGRCVQNVDYFNRDTLGAAPHIPDSLATPYKTKNGRTVYDKGGIEPDIATPDSIPSNILIALVVNNVIFDFCNQYAA
ncbi:MAG: S41 family peptidase, partial [Lentimicrobiaceae bacterium]|nr:S41 family peptidase [Lentimicrobiaceae bacterium]